MLMQSRPGSRFLAKLIEALPYGRQAAPEGAPSHVMMEVFGTLPRAAMHPAGRTIFAAILAKVQTEGPVLSKTTRVLAQRLAQDLAPLVQSPHAAPIIAEAFMVPALRRVLEPAAAHSVDAFSKTPQGCHFLAHLLDHLHSAEVAMAILESPQCFQSFACDADWAQLLVAAGNFSATHHAQLTSQVRVLPVDQQARCLHRVKVAACWK
jgi:hypothetical protein